MRILSLMLGAGLFVLLLCGFSCSTNGTQHLAIASDAVSHSLLDAQMAAQQAVQAGVMSQQDYATLNTYLVGVANAGLALDGAIRQNESATSVNQKVQNFMAAFDALQKTGVVGIKDPKTQLSISTIINGAETAVAVIAAQTGGK